MKLTDIAALLGGRLAGAGDAEIRGVAKIEDAGPGDITFLANPKYAKHLLTTSASAVLIAEDAQFRELAQRKAPLVLVRVADPYVAFLRLVDRMIPPARPLPPGIHGTAVVAQTARVGPGTAVGAHVVIGERCRIGGNASLYPGTVLGDDVEIGDRTLLYPNVTVREGCRIGAGVIIHSGTAVGSDGFGFAPLKDGRYEKIPQRGIVVIEDDVEIGANCAIDRATLGETRIKRGAKLDNLIQVAHNGVIGENTVIAAQTGISGSTKLGRNCVVGGQVGFVGHIEIADRSTIGAQSGVSKSITEPGKTWFGNPVKEIQRALRIQGAVRGLPDLLDEIRKLHDRVLRLEELLHNQESGVR